MTWLTNNLLISTWFNTQQLSTGPFHVACLRLNSKSWQAWNFYECKLMIRWGHSFAYATQPTRRDICKIVILFEHDKWNFRLLFNISRVSIYIPFIKWVSGLWTHFIKWVVYRHIYQAFPGLEALIIIYYTQALLITCFLIASLYVNKNWYKLGSIQLQISYFMIIFNVKTRFNMDVWEKRFYHHHYQYHRHIIIIIIIINIIIIIIIIMIVVTAIVSSLSSWVSLYYYCYH